MFYDYGMYSIYTTEGLVLKSFQTAEAGCSYTILTRDFGLIRADAQGVRKLHSKLRYSLQDFSLVQLALVRGKEKWRITNTVLIRNVFADLRGEVSARVFLARVGALIGRLLAGEEKNEQLFEYVKSAVIFLAENHPQGVVLQNTEYLLVLRILHSLGYIGSSPDWSVFTSSPMFEIDLLMKIGESKRQAIMTINKSLKESHL